MFVLYHSDTEYRQHAMAIHSIADQYHLQETLIRQLYEEVLKDLLTKARFKKYLSVLVTRHVKELLNKSKFKSSN